MRCKCLKDFECPTHKAPAGAIIDVANRFAKIGIKNGELEPYVETAVKKIAKRRAVKRSPRKVADES
mgnify:CR=1 FL=1